VSRGRCSGCGWEHVSCQVVRDHVNTCPDYLLRFKQDPQMCLDPEDEFLSHRRWLETPEGEAWLADRRERRHQEHARSQEKRLVKQRSRWEQGA
jgi:hypothetical protein